MVLTHVPEHRVQWAKTYSRAMRFTEEVLLVQAEMHRVLRFLIWERESWVSRALACDRSEMLSADMQEGLNAYARRQASIREHLRKEFQLVWEPVPTYVRELNRRWAETQSLYYQDLEVVAESGLVD